MHGSYCLLVLGEDALQGTAPVLSVSLDPADQPEVWGGLHIDLVIDERQELIIDQGKKAIDYDKGGRLKLLNLLGPGVGPVVIRRDRDGAAVQQVPEVLCEQVQVDGRRVVEVYPVSFSRRQV